MFLQRVCPADDETHFLQRVSRDNKTKYWAREFSRTHSETMFRNIPAKPVASMRLSRAVIPFVKSRRVVASSLASFQTRDLLDSERASRKEDTKPTV